MKTKKYLSVVIILTMLLVLVSVSSVSAEATKRPVCHVDEMGIFHLINISDNAYDTHIAHGDGAIGGWVPNQPGNKFEADCSITSVPKYTWVETLSIPSTLTNSDFSVISSSALTLNQAYQLRASGTYKFSGGTEWVADAKCSYRVASINPSGIDGWVDGANLANPWEYGLQVSVYDGLPVLPLTSVGWVESCNTAHNYTATYTGTGSSLQLFIWDNNYGDNSGSITVDIYMINW